MSRHTGSESGSWLDLVVDGPFDTLTVGPAGVRTVADPRIDLGDGVIPGGGIVLFSRNGAARAGSIDESSVAAPDVPPPVPAPPEATPQPPPAPAAPPAVLPPPPDPVSPAPAGVLRCRDGHANPLGSRFCATCGLPLLDPPESSTAGALVLDDGTSFPLDAVYVAGRDPSEAGSVRSGHARALALDDPEELISRVHAELRPDPGGVVVIDRDSAQGTFVSRPGANEWTPVEPGVATLVEAGSHVLIGRRTFRVDGPPPTIDVR